MAWTDRLKGYPLEWLLERSDHSVRYWALKELMDKPQSDPEVQSAQEDLMGSQHFKAILGGQSPEGHWGNPGDM